MKGENKQVNHNLQRFLRAQESNYKQALAEITNGYKCGHWMWYVFPQVKGLGRSRTAQYYAIQLQEEAFDYFKHSVLGKRLIEITQTFLNVENISARAILGGTDAMKMKSCMTLFDAIQKETNIFHLVLDKYYAGEKCVRTLEFLEKQ